MLSTALAPIETPKSNDSLQESHDAFMAGIRECKPLNTAFSLNLNLSCVKVYNPLTKLLRADISNNKKFIVNAYISIEIDTQTNEELQFIAEYISSLELQKKSLIIVAKDYSSSLQLEQMAFFIQCLKGESFLKLSLENYFAGSPPRLQSLVNPVGALHIQTLDLSTTGLNELWPEDLKKYLVFWGQTGIACINLSGNPIVEGENLITFARKWFSLNPVLSTPYLQLYPDYNQAETIEKTQSFIGHLDQKTRLALAKSYYASYLINNIYRSLGISVIPFTHFKISNEEKNEIAKLLATLTIRHITKDQCSFAEIFKRVAGALDLDSMDRYLWIRHLMEESEDWHGGFSLRELELSKISETDRLKLFFLVCTKDPDYFYGVSAFGFSFEGNPGCRLLSAFDTMDLNAVLLAACGNIETLVDQSISALVTQSETHLGPASGFVRICANSIQMQHISHGEEANAALGQMISWLGLVCSKIDLMMPELTPMLEGLVEVPGTTSVACIDIFNRVMKKIFDFAHPTGRYALSNAFLEKLFTDSQKTYFKLISDLPLDALLPAIPMTAIILQEQDPILRVKHETLSKELLLLLANRQFYGRFQRTMVAGLMGIADDTSLTSSQKFDIIQAVVSKDRKHLKSEELLENMIKLSKQEKKIETVQEIDTLLLELQTHDALLSKKLQLFRWGFGSQRASEEPSTTATATKDQTKLSSLLQKMGPRIARDLEGIDKAKKPLEVILKNHYEDAHFKRMIAHFIMVQGLAGINRLSALCGFLEVFDLQARLIFQEIFNIKPEQFEHYQKTFEQCHNESALLTYYSKLCTLKGEDAEQTMSVFKSFVQGVLSPDSFDFYRTRYDKTKNPHLAAILEGREALEKAWIPESGPTDYSTALTPFIVKHDIKHRDYEPDFRHFIETKIFGHQHLDSKDCENLKQYLETSDGTEKTQIKEALRAALPAVSVQEPKNDAGENTPTIPEKEILKQYRAQLEWTLIELLEMPIDTSISIDKRYEAHLKTLQKIYQLLSRIYGNGNTFKADIETLMQGLKNNKKPVQPINAESFPGYKLVVTDHYWRMFMCGTDVEGSCQSVDGTLDLNKCLMGYVMNGHVKMVAILDPEDLIVGRCMIKLLKNETTGEPVLFLEEIYPETLRADFREALIQYAIQYAAELGLPLATIQTLPFGYESAGSQAPTGESTSTDEPILECAGGYAVYEYVDAIFEPTQGPYTIEKGVQWIYQPAPKPAQVPVPEEIAEPRQTPEPAGTVASVQTSMPAVAATAMVALTFAFGRLSETPDTVEETTPRERLGVVSP